MKMRFLTTSQIGQLYFEGSRWSANKRMRKLFDSKLVKVWMRSLSEENVYSVSRRGIEAVEEHCLKVEAKAPLSLEGNLAHLLAINDVRVSFALNLSKAAGEIMWWHSDWDLRAHGTARIIPDALFRVNWDGLHEKTYALELDNNTKSPMNFRKKIFGYAALGEGERNIYGETICAVLVVGRDPKWIYRYESDLKDCNVQSNIAFTTLTLIKEQRATSSIWTSCRGETYSLRELSFFPYGNDTFAEANSGNSIS